MEENQEIQLHIMGQEAKDNDHEVDVRNEPIISRKSKYKRWIRVGLYTLFVLAGQAVAAVLTRLYYDKGGSSKWFVTSLQFIGFPIILPFYFAASRTPAAVAAAPDLIDRPHSPSASFLKIAVVVYLPLGLLSASNGFLYSLGLMYLPVSTYALLTSSQLAFNAIFSYFLNSQKFTSYIINSLVLLTCSSILLVFESTSESSGNESKGKLVAGFICTIAASAGYGLILSLTQVAFQKVIKEETFRAVMDMIVYQSLVASVAIVVALFISREWKWLGEEMEEFPLGKVCYAMIFLWMAVFWQVYTIGSVGLIFDVSSLFSNVISILGVPIAPILGTIFFHEKMSGLKVMAMVLAIWGLGSYVYQHYLDDFNSKEQTQNAQETSESQNLINRQVEQE